MKVYYIDLGKINTYFFVKLFKVLIYCNIILFSCSEKCLNDDYSVPDNLIEAEKLLKIKLTFEVNADHETGTENIIFTNTCTDNIYISSIEDPCVDESFSFSLINSVGKDLYAEKTFDEHRPVVRPQKCNKNSRILISPDSSYIVKRIVSLEACFSSCNFSEKYALVFEYKGKIYLNRKKIVEKAAIRSNSINVWLDSTNTIQFE
jgi:hypothetical protein